MKQEQLFTIQDLADGKCALEYDGSNLALLKKVLYEAFPFDNGVPAGCDKFYFQDNEKNTEWFCSNSTRMSSQALHLFDLEEPKPNKEEGKDSMVNIDSLLSEFKRQGFDVSNWDGEQGAEKAIVDGVVRHIGKTLDALFPPHKPMIQTCKECGIFAFSSDGKMCMNGHPVK